MIKLKELRKKKGLKQKDIANLLQIQESAVSKIELEKTVLNANQIIILCKALDARADELLGLLEVKE